MTKHYIANCLMFSIVVFLSLCVCDHSAFAGSSGVVETEPNDSLLSAQFVPFVVTPGPEFHQATVFATLTQGDVDFYQVIFPVLTVLNVTVFELTEGVPTDHDCVLALFASDGTLIASNEGQQIVAPISTLPELVLPTGTYYVGVSGGTDLNFIGAHVENFEYTLSLSFFLVPSPAAGLLLLALPLARSRRRTVAGRSL